MRTTMLRFRSRRIGSIVWFLCVLLTAITPVSHGQPVDPSTAAAVECAPTIAFGQTMLCALAVAGEVDSFSFTAGAGDRVSLRMATPAATPDPYIRVISPSATTVCSASSYNAGVAIDSCMLPASGVYTIEASDLGANDIGLMGYRCSA